MRTSVGVPTASASHELLLRLPKVLVDAAGAERLRISFMCLTMYKFAHQSNLPPRHRSYTPETISLLRAMLACALFGRPGLPLLTLC